MRILVLGATGFTGAAFLDYLCNIKGLSVTALVHNRPPAKRHAQVHYLQAALSDIELSFLQSGNFDIIFHLARIPGKRWGDVGRTLAGWQGAKANRRLLAAINKLDKRPKLIYLSGSLMYGHMPGGKATENSKLNPAGFAKYYLHAEQPILKAINNGADNIMMLRAPWIIGDGSWYKQLYTEHVVKHNSVPIYGNPQRQMSVITVEDCAAMLWHYAANAPYASIYNIYTFQQVAYKSFVQYIADAYKCNELKQYTKDEMIGKMGKTAADSVNCEIILDTKYTTIKERYQPIYPDLAKYITEKAKG